MKEYKGKRYIICVNVEPEELNIEINVPKNIKRSKVISENRIVEVKSGKFSDKFLPYEVHIYTNDLNFQDLFDLKKVEEKIKKRRWVVYL